MLSKWLGVMQAPIKIPVRTRGGEAGGSGECIIQEPALNDKHSSANSCHRSHRAIL